MTYDGAFTSMQPLGSQQVINIKAANLKIYKLSTAVSFLKLNRNHKSLDNFFMCVSAFLVSFPFFSLLKC